MIVCYSPGVLVHRVLLRVGPAGGRDLQGAVVVSDGHRRRLHWPVERWPLLYWSAVERAPDRDEREGPVSPRPRPRPRPRPPPLIAQIRDSRAQLELSRCSWSLLHTVQYRILRSNNLLQCSNKCFRVRIVIKRLKWLLTKINVQIIFRCNKNVRAWLDACDGITLTMTLAWLDARELL